jgi:tryptophan halogenase
LAIVNKTIDKVVILGGGTAGFLAALTFRKRFPELPVVVIYSPDIPVIGVGESTTWLVPQFLHNELGLDRDEFFREVRPSWKLGLRLEWGDPADTHFNYPFDLNLDEYPDGLGKSNAFCMLNDMSDSSLFSALMDRGKSPCVLQAGQYSVDQRTAYHVQNESLIEFLQRKAEQVGVEMRKGKVIDVCRNQDGNVESVRLADGGQVAGDLFVDCSGFRSLLLGQTLAEKYVDYGDTLFCDAAIVGSWNRDDDVRPYTTVETMDHGWCWRIDFADVVTRGYVFSTAFCEPDQAMREMKQKNPELGDDLRVIRFKCGRYENFWVRNVAAVGNASGFVEPLEATALHLIVKQVHFLTLALEHSGCRINPAMQNIENQRFRRMWDDVRDFLAVHYRFNRKLDTPFWRHCREATSLGGAAELVDYYQHAGPSGLCNALTDPLGIFGHQGYLNMLIGQRVPTSTPLALNAPEQQQWTAYRERFRLATEAALPMREALQRVHRA